MRCFCAELIVVSDQPDSRLHEPHAPQATLEGHVADGRACNIQAGVRKKNSQGIINFLEAVTALEIDLCPTLLYVQMMGFFYFCCVHIPVVSLRP